MRFVSFVFDLISGILPMTLILAVGVYLTVKGNFFQIKGLHKSFSLLKKSLKNKSDNGGISSFSAACTALSSTVGTGNIAGVAGAISLGGAGAVFWMWVSAFFSSAVKFAEIKLAVKYRKRKGNGFVGGAMYYIKKAFSGRFSFLAPIYSAVMIPAVIFSGNIVQTNAVVSVFEGNSFLKIAVGVLFCLLCALVLAGGVKRVTKISEILAPIMAVVYIISTIIIISANYQLLPQAFLMIVEGAFKPSAVTGGVVGSLISSFVSGASRGVFSNEAGLGTSALVHAAADDANEQTQGCFGIFEVFVDTEIICTLTALTILCSGVKIEYGTVASSELVLAAFSTVFGKFSSSILALLMLVFAFSSITAWGAYGRLCTSHLFGKRAELFFAAIYPLFCLCGVFLDAASSWWPAAFFSGLLLCINLPVILFSADEVLDFRRLK